VGHRHGRDRRQAHLVGEAWFAARPATEPGVRRVARQLLARSLPPIAKHKDVIRAVFVPAVAPSVPRTIDGVHIVTLPDLL
jgi:hypothetical protein